MLTFEFMRRTLAVGAMLSIMIPLIGVIMVNRKTSMVGDALSHTSLAGIGLGLILGWDLMLAAIIVCIFAAYMIEGIRERFPQYGDMATAIILSLGLGIASILSDFAPGGNSFESYLFGSISSTSPQDLVIVAIAFVFVVAFSVMNYGSLLAISINPELARLSGVPVRRINHIFTFLSAITIALSCKIVGALLVTSLMVLPVATALFVSRSYKQVYVYSVVLGFVYMMAGLILSYYFNIKPGGAIIVLAIIGMTIAFIISKVRGRRNAADA